MKPILIAGAGPVGCVVALYLAQKGIPIILIEAEKTLPKDLRASTFHPPTLDMLSGLGIVDEMLGIGLKVTNYQHRDRKTNKIAKFYLSALEGETEHPYRLQCEQYKMAGIVIEKLKAFANAEVRFGCSINGYRETTIGVEALVFKDNQEERIECSFLVGCDGANSVVRKSSGTMFEGMTYPESFLVASTTYRFENYFEDLSLVNYVSDPDEWCVLLATSAFWRVLIPTPIGEDSEIFLTNDFIQDRLHRLADNTSDFDIVHKTLYRVHQRVAETYRVGARVVLAGDAAHVNNPIGGMGMNGGIHDAMNIAKKLASIIESGTDYNEVLDIYDRQRRIICKRFIQAHTKKNKILMEATDKNVQKARSEHLMKCSEDPALAKTFLMETSMINCLRDSYEIT